MRRDPSKAPQFLRLGPTLRLDVRRQAHLPRSRGCSMLPLIDKSVLPGCHIRLESLEPALITSRGRGAEWQTSRALRLRCAFDPLGLRSVVSAARATTAAKLEAGGTED